MFDPRWKFTGIRHTTTVAFSIAAIVFSPAVLAIAGNFSACGAGCQPSGRLLIGPVCAHSQSAHGFQAELSSLEHP
jgi:hypothetical protein